MYDHDDGDAAEINGELDEDDQGNGDDLIMMTMMWAVMMMVMSMTVSPPAQTHDDEIHRRTKRGAVGRLGQPPALEGGEGLRLLG